VTTFSGGTTVAESGSVVPSGGTARPVTTIEVEVESEVPLLASRLGTGLRAAGFVLQVLEPWLELIRAWAGTLAEAKARLKQEYYGLGFAEGMAASLLGFSAKEATEMLIYPDPSRGPVGAQVAGFGGVRHPATLSGRRDGWKFAGQLGSKEQGAFRTEGFARIKEKGHTIGPNFNFNDVVEFAVVLKAINEELAEAARQEEERKHPFRKAVVVM
jgi:hypothetical protein